MIFNLDKVNHSCTIYLAQINNYLSQNRLESFKCAKELFDKVAIMKPNNDDIEEINYEEIKTPEEEKEEFENGKHYVVFKDIYSSEKNESTMVQNDFQRYMEQFLMAIDLSSYYSNIDLDTSVDDLIKLIKHAEKYPEHFFVDPKKYCQIQVLTINLRELFDKGEITTEIIRSLINSTDQSRVTSQGKLKRPIK